MLVNLCHFQIRIAGTVYPAAAPKPLVFSPRLAGDSYAEVQTLTGHDAPRDLPALPPGTPVIVPRFAPAIAWAYERDLQPYCVPLEHLGDRGAPNGGEVVLDSIASDLTPRYLAVDYPAVDLGPLPTGLIQRMVGGTFPIQTHWGDFAPVPAGAVDHPDGTATLPELDSDAVAVIVPHSGPCVRAAAALGVAVLVVGPRLPGRDDVDLYRVA